jgi:hypothetical protein
VDYDLAYDAGANLGKQRVVCGFSWLLRVIDHEAVLMDPKLFSSWVQHRPVVLLKRGFGRQTRDNKQLVALLASRGKMIG